MFIGNGYSLKSNKESGDGRFDIVLYPEYFLNKAIVIECKLSESREKLLKNSKALSLTFCSISFSLSLLNASEIFLNSLLYITKLIL